MDMNPAPILADIDAAQRRLLERADSIDELRLRQPSTLPGWSRSHVLAHLAMLADSLARQVELAPHDRYIEIYDGGSAGRDAGIETGSRRTAEQHREEFRRALKRIGAAWPTDSEGWQQRVSFRDGVVLDVLLAWWREVRIHLVDLDAGDGYEGWNESLCHHLFGFLAVRLPGSERYRLWANDTGYNYELGSGATTVTITGGIRDLVAWLAGRIPDALPTAEVGGARVPLPVLGPWPSARV